MTKQIHFLFLFLSVFLVGTIRSMIYDNRFFPWQRLVPIYIVDRPSYLIVSPFVTTADSAYNKNQDQVPLFSLCGQLDITKLGTALEQIGLPNPLPSLLRIGSNPFLLSGKVQSQGVALIYRQEITDWFQFGLSTLFMHAHARQNFLLNTDSAKDGITRILEPGTLQTLDLARKDMLNSLCLRQNDSDQSGIGDFDVYVRFRKAWDYIFKFRRIEAGFSVGGLLPSGQSIDIFEPTSVPFGGNGHWGAYIAADAEFEIKEDWTVGMLFRLNKRFARTTCLRLPTCEKETTSNGQERVTATVPIPFGTVVGQFRVNPGPTFIWSPYVTFENLRDGFGIGVQYVLTTHRKDSIDDRRCDKSIEPNICEAQEKSIWASDYVGLAAFYDFGKMKVDRGFSPIVMLQWDVPMALLVADKVPRTHRVSLAIQFNF